MAQHANGGRRGRGARSAGRIRWALVAILGASACGEARTQSSPGKSAAASLTDPKPRRQPADPTGQSVAPGPRQPQLPRHEVESTLTEAKRVLAAGEPQQATPLLRRCANKTPASARCDGELGIVLSELGTERAETRYFLAEAAKTPDPDASDDLYRRVAAAAQKRGYQSTRAEALARLIARDVATAGDYHEQGQALSADAAKIPEALEALRIAYTKDPSQGEWLLERGVLAAQHNDHAGAITILQAFLEQTPRDDPSWAVASKWLARAQARLKKGAPKPKRPVDAATREAQTQRPTVHLDDGQ